MFACLRVFVCVCVCICALACRGKMLVCVCVCVCVCARMCQCVRLFGRGENNGMLIRMYQVMRMHDGNVYINECIYKRCLPL